jgi:hypothetical protein
VFDYSWYATARLNTLTAINDALAAGDSPQDVIGAAASDAARMMHDTRPVSPDLREAIESIAYPRGDW